MNDYRRFYFFLGGMIALVLIININDSAQIPPEHLQSSAHFQESTSILDDNDLDGLSDKIETELTGTNPHNPDSDGDGAKDGFEVLIRQSDPLVP